MWVHCFETAHLIHITSDQDSRHYTAPAGLPSLHMHGEQDAIILWSPNTQHDPLPLAGMMGHGFVMLISIINDYCIHFLYRLFACETQVLCILVLVSHLFFIQILICSIFIDKVLKHISRFMNLVPCIYCEK